ncbi:unnamed protein product [Echinostoma caproni]|uniref:Secreted protein n=1 Tax=Echinostoma caproni TaxID=27848 RepID=A0A183AK34_9TREM|nr:unnamed protein product [Echinostoma caproni]
MQHYAVLICIQVHIGKRMFRRQCDRVKWNSWTSPNRARTVGVEKQVSIASGLASVLLTQSNYLIPPV